MACIDIGLVESLCQIGDNISQAKFVEIRHWRNEAEQRVCVNKPDHHGIRYRLVACSTPSHYPNKCWSIVNWTLVNKLKDRAHLSTFKFSIFEKFSCFIVLVVFLVIVQSSELISVWFCEKMTFKIFFISYHIFAIYVGGASLGVPTACRLIAVSGARLPSADGLAVRCIKNAPPC